MAASIFDRHARRFLAQQEGSTAVEYAIIASMITLAILGGLALMAGGSSSMWGRVEREVGGALR